jgi:mRNA-degrading endonuclease RelE of RelBE toxin-antitoxin system
MYEYHLTSLAEENLDRVVQHNPELAAKIIRKIEWLAQNAEQIAHQRIKGSPYFSLHSGAYRIAYALDSTNRVVQIFSVGQHDLTYRRVNRLK